MKRRRHAWRAFNLTLGYLFLYVPIACLMVFSFNASSLMSRNPTAHGNTVYRERGLTVL